MQKPPQFPKPRKPFIEHLPPETRNSSVFQENLALLSAAWTVAKLIYLCTIGIPAGIVDQLTHTRFGLRALNVIPFLIAAVALGLLANMMQSTAGDGVYLLWAVFVAKWIFEVIWAFVRQARGAHEHPMDPGELVFSVIGLRSEFLSNLLVGIFGFILVSAFPTSGWLVGLILLFGAIGSTIFDLLAMGKVRSQFADRRASQIEAEWRQGAEPDGQVEATFVSVRRE